MARVLIMDDDDQIRKVLEMFFLRQGYEVDVAENGNEGLRLFRENPPDVAIIDIIMPEKEGLEVIQCLRREYPDVKMIAISGGGRVGPDDYLLLAKSFGAQTGLTKPFSLADVEKEVESLLSS